MSVDLTAALRRRRPEKRVTQLRPRPAGELLAVADAPAGPLPLLPDTNVYIRSAAGTLPPEVEALLDRALLFHCSVCLAELATDVANANPGHASWLAMRRHYEHLLSAIPDTRVRVPDAQTWADAGVLAGILSRIQGFRPEQRKEMLNDALIYLTAARSGISVLTANRDDFDLLQQLAPEGRFYHF